MKSVDDSILDTPLTNTPDPDAFIQAAMRWHFGPDTGPCFWLDRAARSGFDPIRDVTTMDDLALFPDFCNELHDTRVEDLIPRGYSDPQIVGVCESGGTTERLAADEELVDLVRAKITTIQWGGAHMAPDTRHLLRTEVFPGITLIGSLGNTVILGGTRLRSADTPQFAGGPPAMEKPSSRECTDGHAARHTVAVLSVEDCQRTVARVSGLPRSIVTSTTEETLSTAASISTCLQQARPKGAVERLARPRGPSRQREPDQVACRGDCSRVGRAAEPAARASSGGAAGTTHRPGTPDGEARADADRGYGGLAGW
ncbi:hypothetical protein [Streptomyces sp. MST-110588]|uniref:hypothetical protein n=1 Tax=Streptomyces sp. MST-110588 TaxID=2833628 RepID=UPI001F5C8DBC|nr:hypothetical protein [Streptomyces sp. MST-110588]UNO43594.1 hypothetical protein KGS77_34105 [Streptomyces sp. MST-110588]